MTHYYIRVTHPDGSQDWVGQINFNGTLETTADLNIAVIFDEKFANAFIDTIEADGCSFEKVSLNDFKKAYHD